MRIKLLLFVGILFCALSVQSQEYLEMIDEGTYKVQEVIDKAEAYFADKDKGRGTGYKQFKRWEYNSLRLMNDNGYLPTITQRINEVEDYNAYLNQTAQSRPVLPDNWEEMGPKSWSATSGWNPGVGRLTGVAIDGADIDHMIVGANTGGVWKTLDGGQNWLPLGDFFSNLSVYSVAMDPNDSSIYYFGSVGGRLFKSIDSGATWKLQGLVGSSRINKILINPTDTDIMFATSESQGIYRSDDGGSNWVEVSDDLRGYDIEFKPGDVSVVYVSGSKFSKSVDGGVTFTSIGGFSNGAKMIGVSEDNPEKVYVIEASGNTFGAFYVSEDGGDSFTSLDQSGKNYFGYSSTGNDNRGQAPRDMGIAINPTDANEVHIAGLLTWKSVDGGVSFTVTSQWQPALAANENIGYCHSDIDDIMFYGTTLFVVSDGGLYKAEDTETVDVNYFEDLTAGLGIRQFYKIGVSQTSDVVVSGGSQDNGTSVYKEGSGWKDWLGADGMETFVDKTNSSILFGTSQYGKMYRSSNGGITYFGMNEPGDEEGKWVTPFEQDPADNLTIYVGYEFVYKSNNAGNSWEIISQDFIADIDNLKIAPSNNQVMYASRLGFVYKTEDGGATDWSQQAFPGGTVSYIAVHPTNANKIAVTMSSSSKIKISEDGGETWIDYKKNLPDFAALSVIWDDNGKDGLYLGMDYGIYYIDDTFTEWQPYSNMLPNVQINELEINNETNMLYAGTYGRGLWSSPLVSDFLGVADFISSDNVSIHPNPATTEITISLAKSLNAEVRVFDLSGKLLIYQPEALLGSTHKVDVSALPSGAYFIRLNTEAGTVTKKMLKK